MSVMSPAEGCVSETSSECASVSFCPCFMSNERWKIKWHTSTSALGWSFRKLQTRSGISWILVYIVRVSIVCVRMTRICGSYSKQVLLHFGLLGPRREASRWYEPRFSRFCSRTYQGCRYARISRRRNLSRAFLPAHPLAKFLVKDKTGFGTRMSNLSITATHSRLRSDSRINSMSSCCVNISDLVAWASTSLWSTFTFCHRAIREIEQVFAGFRYAAVMPEFL